MIRKRNRLWKRFKRSNDPVHYHQNKKIRNAVVSLNRKNILAYHNRIEDQLINNSNPKLFWKSIKNIISHKSDFGIPPIKHADIYINDDKEKCELFNKYFADQCRLEDIVHNHSLPDFHVLTDTTLDIPVVTKSQILNILRKLQSNEATGPDGIGNFIIL